MMANNNNNNNDNSEEYEKLNESTNIIKPLDTDALNANSVFVLLGPRNQGKTTILLNLLYVFQYEYDAIVLMTPTQETINDFKKFCPNSMLYNAWDEERAIQIMNFLTKATQSDDPHQFRIALILDDLMGTKEVMKTDVISDIFKRGRHVGLGLYVLCQCGTDIHSKFRSNIEIIFQLRDSSIPHLKFTYSNYFSIIQNEKTFIGIMNSVVKSRGQAIVYDRTKSEKWSNCIFSFKSMQLDKLPLFMLGHRDFWILHSIYAIDKTEYNKVPGSKLFKKIESVKTLSHADVVNNEELKKKTNNFNDNNNNDESIIKKKKKKNRMIPLSNQLKTNKTANNVLIMDVSTSMPRQQQKTR